MHRNHQTSPPSGGSDFAPAPPSLSLRRVLDLLSAIAPQNRKRKNFAQRTKNSRSLSFGMSLPLPLESPSSAHGLSGTSAPARYSWKKYGRKWRNSVSKLSYLPRPSIPLLSVAHSSTDDPISTSEGKSFCCEREGNMFLVSIGPR